MNTHTKGTEQCHHGLLTEEASGLRPPAPPRPWEEHGLGDPGG